MLRPVLVSLAALSLLPLLLRPPAVQAQPSQEAHITQVDTSEFPWVTVYISVTDAEGMPSPIDPARLEILENGQAIEPEQIEGFGEAGPLNAMLVFDVSGSMNEAGKLEQAKRAARAFIESMRPQDRVGLIAFDVVVHRVAPLTSDQLVLHQAIDELGGVRDTALFDALVAAVQDLDGVEGRRAIIVLSDGMDNSSTHSLEDVIGGIGPAGLSIYTIGLGDPEQPAGSLARLDVESLQSLADSTGGAYAFASRGDELGALYESLAQRLQSEYAVRYQSPSALRDGLRRELTVDLAAAPSAPAVTEYNPGGLVPEVGEPVSWALFAALLLGLIGLAFVPALAQRGLALAGRARRPSSSARGRVRLREEPPREPRVRLR
jgi:VWFA-related protein